MKREALWLVAAMLIVAAGSRALSQAGHATIRRVVTDSDAAVFASAFVTVSCGPEATFNTATGAMADTAFRFLPALTSSRFRSPE